MNVEGGCYCGAIRYAVEGEAPVTGQCHCRECQYISGGSPNMFAGVPEGSFRYTKASPKAFTRSDLPAPVTREFCAECGTHILTRAPSLAGMLILKLGTLDDPTAFGGPKMAIFLKDRQPFHVVPAGVATFDRFPG